jgi:flagellar motor switch protein FliN/FliY
MSEAVDYVPFETTIAAPAEPPAADAAGLERLHDVLVELTVEVGRTRMTIRDTLALGPGSIISLDRLSGEPVDLLVNGKRIARGEVVVIDEEFGLRITDVVAGSRNVEDEAAAQAALAAEAEAELMQHVAGPGPGFGPHDPLGQPALDPLGAPAPFEGDGSDLPLGGLPTPDAELS